MTKADQARELFDQDPTLNVAKIASQLGMHYSHARAALKSRLTQVGSTSVKPQVKNMRFSTFVTAIADCNEARIREYLMSKCSDVDWYYTFKDSSDLMIIPNNDELYIELIQFHVEDYIAINSPFGDNEFIKEIKSIVGKKATVSIHDSNIQTCLLKVKLLKKQ